MPVTAYARGGEKWPFIAIRHTEAINFKPTIPRRGRMVVLLDEISWMGSRTGFVGF